MNLFIASALRWPERGLELQQETAFPDEARTRLVLSLQRPAALHAARPTPVMGGGGGFADSRKRPSVARRLDAVFLRRRHPRVAQRRPRGDRSADADDDRAPAGWVGLCRRSCTARSCSRPGREPSELEGSIAGDGRMAHVSPGPIPAARQRADAGRRRGDVRRITSVPSPEAR